MNTKKFGGEILFLKENYTFPYTAEVLSISQLSMNRYIFRFRKKKLSSPNGNCKVDVFRFTFFLVSGICVLFHFTRHTNVSRSIFWTHLNHYAVDSLPLFSSVMLYSHYTDTFFILSLPYIVLIRECICIDSCSRHNP